MRRAVFIASWLMVGLGHAADEIEPLDGDFLEYLANMEDEDDDWTLVEKLRSKADDSESQAAKQPEPRKTSKEAAQPAVEER